MSIYTTLQAEQNLSKLVDTINETHDPIYIVGKHHKAVLLSEEEYASIIETLYLSSIPGMKESILTSSQALIEEFLETCDL